MTGEEIDQNICEVQAFIMRRLKWGKKKCSLNEAVTFYRQGGARFPLMQEALPRGLFATPFFHEGQKTSAVVCSSGSLRKVSIMGALNGKSHQWPAADVKRRQRASCEALFGGRGPVDQRVRLPQ